MKNLRKLSRRSFMSRVVGGAVVGGGAMMALGGRASALQVTDNDTGPNSDPANRTGLTDRDPSDPAGNAPVRRRACSDNDSGSNSDPAGRGRGNGRSDNDSGANSDPAGCGRR
jgi:hypothetical protein